MKKALLGTSALVGAGLLAFSPAPASANDLELSISGNLILGAYAIDGEDYNKGAQTSVTYNVGARGTGPASAPVNNLVAGDYRVCWNGKSGDDSSIQLGGSTGLTTTQNVPCDIAGNTNTGHTTELASGTALAADLTRITGGSVVTRPTNGDKAESNDFTILNAASRYVFDTKGTLDNGLGVGSRVRMEATSQNNAASQIDEHYVWVDGGFGLIQVGAKNGASYQMHYAAPWFTNNGVDSPNFRNQNRSSSAGTETYADISNDAYKINYFTPRFSGVQFGASYAPDGSDGNGTRSYNGAYDNLGVDTQDVYSLGANYVSTVGDVDVAFSGGYVTATARDKNADDTDRNCAVHSGLGGVLSDTRGVFGNGIVNTFTAAPAKCEDPSEWSVGTSLSMSGFTVGGAYNVAENLGGVKDTERTSWSAGVKYTEGLWNVGVAYYQGTLERGGRFTGTSSTSTFTNGTGEVAPDEAELDGPAVAGNVNWDDAENTFLLIGAGYKLGSGVNLGAEIQIIEDTNPLAVITGTGQPSGARSSGPETIKTNSIGLTLAVGF